MLKFYELPDLHELWNHDRPDQTESKFREIIPIVSKKANPDYFVQLLTQIARARVLQQDLDGAHMLLDEADEILTEECTIGQIRSLLERGRTYSASGDNGKAGSLFLKALVKSYKAGTDQYTVDAAHMLAIISKPEDAVQWNELALKIVDDSKSERVHNWRGTLFNNIGWAYHDNGDYKSALSCFKKSLTFRQEKRQPKQTRIAKWTVARTLRSLKKSKEALTMQRKLLEDYKSACVDEVGFVSEEIGECLWDLGKTVEAKPYLARAYEKLRNIEWIINEAPERIESLKKRGGINDMSIIKKN